MILNGMGMGMGMVGGRCERVRRFPGRIPLNIEALGILQSQSRGGTRNTRLVQGRRGYGRRPLYRRVEKGVCSR